MGVVHVRAVPTTLGVPQSFVHVYLTVQVLLSAFVSGCDSNGTVDVYVCVHAGKGQCSDASEHVYAHPPESMP